MVTLCQSKMAQLRRRKTAVRRLRRVSGSCPVCPAKGRSVFLSAPRRGGRFCRGTAGCRAFLSVLQEILPVLSIRWQSAAESGIIKSLPCRGRGIPGRPDGSRAGAKRAAFCTACPPVRCKRPIRKKIWKGSLCGGFRRRSPFSPPINNSQTIRKPDRNKSPLQLSLYFGTVPDCVRKRQGI